MAPVDSRLAVLSYHSWEISAATLERDISDLRRSGWALVGAGEAMEYAARGRGGNARLGLVTTDDGHPEDERFLEVLRATTTPAVSFINLGRIEPQRRQWYAGLASDSLFAVEDHGAWHRRVFVSSVLYGFATPGVGYGGLEHFGLAPGSPLFASAGEIAERHFTPDPEAVRVCTEAAAASGFLPGSEGWKAELEAVLLERRLARRIMGRIVVRGVFESRAEYERRVAAYLHDGRELFTRVLGRAPTLYAHTWWQGSRFADTCLRDLGYAGSFSGIDFVQPADGGAFAIPRIPVDEKSARPLRLAELPVRPKWEFPVRAVRAAIRESLGMR